MRRFVLNKYQFALAVRAWIAGRNLRQMAEETGISAPVLSRIQNGQGLSVDALITLCKLMNVNPMDFGFWLEVDDDDGE